MGQIIPRGPGKWLVRAFIRSEMVNGKRKQKRVAKVVKGTHAAAQRALAALSTDIERGTFVPPSTQTLREYVEWWLADVAATRVSGATLRSYRERIRPMLEAVGYLKLDRISTQGLQSAAERLGAGPWLVEAH